MSSATARKLSELTYEEQQRRYEVIQGNRKQRRRQAVSSWLFLGACVAIFAFTLTYYISIQSQITGLSKEISGLKSTLNELKLDNDENYSRITSDVNLEEIRRVAIQELGMKYADEGQIISFDGEGSDYVRQTGSIPMANN